MHQVHLTGSIKIRFLLLLASIFSLGHAFPQANVVNNASDPKHETANQQVISVLFDAALTGSMVASDWSVFVDGIPVTTVSATVSGSRVLVQFDASIAPGHASEKYVLPGEVLTISFTNSSTLSANSFASITSKNNLVFTCSEMIFFQQGSYDVVDFCSPVMMDFFQFQYYVSLRFRNSSLYNIIDFRSNIQWGDGNAVQSNNPFFQSDASGASSTTFVSATGFSGNPAVVLTQQPTHNYPDANPTDCSFDIALTPYHTGSAVICNSIATTKSIATYDYDNANSGVLTLEPAVPLTNLICLGSNVNMQFSDDSQLNCRAAIEAILPNDQSRWIRIIYGSTDYAFGNIPDIRVNGVLVTQNDATGTLIYPTGYYPTGAGGIGMPDANGVIELATPVTVSTGITHMLPITTIDPTNQVIDQRFYVRVEYWNICNPYDAGNAVTLGDAVSIENYDIIIDSPPPPGFSPTVFCESLADNTYVVTALGTGAGTYNWYSTFPLVVAGDLEKTGSSFNPVTEATVPSVVAKSPLSATTTNFYLTETLVSGCVSLPATVPFTIHKVVNPGTIQYLGTPICFGADPPIINSMTLATGGDGLTYAYQWQESTTGVPASFMDIPLATAISYNPPALTQTTYFRRVATSGVCTPMPSPAVTITVNSLPTGVVSGGGNACNDGTNSTSAPSIIFTFTGSSPFDFQYAINGVPQAIINNVSSPYILTPIIGTYTLVSFPSSALGHPEIQVI